MVFALAIVDSKRMGVAVLHLFWHLGFQTLVDKVKQPCGNNVVLHFSLGLGDVEGVVALHV